MDTRQNIINTQQGFSLLEVLVAIVILSFISFTTFQMTDSSITTKERVTSEDRELVQVNTFMNRIEADFSQSYSPLFFDNHKGTTTTSLNPDSQYDQDTSANFFESNKYFYNKSRLGFLIPNFISEDKGSLVFLSTSHRRRIEGRKESRFTWIKYSLRNSVPSEEEKDKSENEKRGGNNEFVRQTYVSDIYVKDIDWGKVPEQIVLKNIKDFEFLFWDARTKKYTNNINDLNENRYLIRSIKLEMTWIDSNNNEQYFEKAFRVVWPYFNPKEDDALGANDPSNSNPNNPFGFGGNGGQGNSGNPSNIPDGAMP